MLPVTAGLSYWETCLRTFLVYTGFLSLGMTFSIVGPTLQDFSFRLGISTADMSTIFTARSGGLIVGALIGGCLLERFNRVRVIGLFYSVCGVCTALLPWGSSLAVLTCVMVANGFSMGAVDTGSTVWCLDLWPLNPGPFVHALHFCFGVGSFMAPLIGERFLIPSAITEDYMNRSMSAATTNGTHNVTFAPIRYDGYYEEISFGIIGFLMFLLGIATLFVSAVNPIDSKRRLDDKDSDEQLQTLTRRGLVVAIVALVMLHFMIYCGIIVAYGQLVSSYAVFLPEDKRLTKSEASFLVSEFWGAFMIGRGAAIFISHFVSCLKIIFVDHVIIILSCTSLWLFAEQSTLVLWIATFTYGFGMSAIYPSIYGWVNSKILVSNRIAGFFAVGTSVGEMLLPFWVGQYLEARPQFLMESTAVCGSLMVVVFICLFLTIAKLDRTSRTSSEDDAFPST